VLDTRGAYTFWSGSKFSAVLLNRIWNQRPVSKNL